MSNALSKSMKRPMVCLLLEMALDILSLSLMIWSMVERWRLKPVWAVVRILLDSRCHWNREVMSFSVSLQMADVRDIGRYDDGRDGSLPALNKRRMTECFHVAGTEP